MKSQSTDRRYAVAAMVISVVAILLDCVNLLHLRVIERVRDENAVYQSCMEGEAKINAKLVPDATQVEGLSVKDGLTRLSAGHFRCVGVVRSHREKQILTDRYTMNVTLGDPGLVELEKVEHVKVEPELTGL